MKSRTIHNVMSVLKGLGITLIAVIPVTAYAQTYTYTGQNLAILSGSNYTRVTASVTLVNGTPLTGFIPPSAVSSWTVSDGVHTIASGQTDCYYGSFTPGCTSFLPFLTGTGGNITQWSIGAVSLSADGQTVTWIQSLSDANAPNSIFQPGAGDATWILTSGACLSATDPACNTASTSSTGSWSSQQSAPQLLSGLIGFVQTLDTTQKKSLTSQITAVLNDLQTTGPTCTDLQSLKNHVKAQSGKQLTADAANSILNQINLIAAAIPCTLN